MYKTDQGLLTLDNYWYVTNLWSGIPHKYIAAVGLVGVATPDRKNVCIYNWVKRL